MMHQSTTLLAISEFFILSISFLIQLVDEADKSELSEKERWKLYHGLVQKIKMYI